MTIIEATPSDPAEGNRAKPLIFLVAGAMFMENLDGTIITTALPTMAHAFGHTAVDLSIGISAYLIALGIFIPASSWIADRFGTRRVFASAIVLFTIASALCGLSSTLTQFVATRIVQGLAGAMMVPVGRLVVLRQTSPERMMGAMAMLVWPALIAPVLGPPLGGLITTHLGRRWIFYLNLPLGLVALLVSLALVPQIRSEKSAPFDWAGFALCGTGTLALLCGLERLAERIDLLGAMLLGGGVLLLAVAVRHFRRAAFPMLDLSAYRIASFRMVVRGGSLSRMVIGSAPFLLPLAFQVGFGFSAETAGFLMLAVFLANLGLKTVTSRILRRFGFRSVLVWNGLACAAALTACALLRADTPLPVIVAVLMLGGATRSMQFTALGMLTFADVPKPGMSGANGLSSTISQLSMGAGIALGALSVRSGGALAEALHWRAPAGAFSAAFLIVAAVSLLGVLDAGRLPRETADRFVGGGGHRPSEGPT